MTAPFQVLLAGSMPLMKVQFLGAWGFNATSFATSIGAADASRFLVVAGAASVLTGLVFNSTALTQRIISGHSFIYTIPWPTGTSGTFGVTGSAFFDLASYAVWGSASDVPTATLAGNGNINKYAGGVTLGTHYLGSGGWTGLTQDWQEPTIPAGGASDLNLGGLIANAAVSYSGATNVAAAAWKPAGT